MENHRAIKPLLCLLLFTISCATPSFVFSYSPDTTHAALTQEIVKFFNQSFPTRHITPDDMESVIKGSIDEDKGIRFMQHFYDPVHKRGLTLEATTINNPNLAFVAAGAKSQWQSSKDWAEDTLGQAGAKEKLFGGVLMDYFGGQDDYSWKRAIYEYAWGSKTRGLESLGHVLHLLEDATVPDHTRNDPHPHVLNQGSPYEDWTKQFDRSHIDVASQVRGEKPVLLSSIGSYFDIVANYSNNNFFSKDTIFDKGYSSPRVIFERKEVLSDGKIYRFGYGKAGIANPFRLVLLPFSDRWHEAVDERPQLKDKDNLILSSYFTLLSRSAVLHGAGVVKLFFDEVEKEKQTKTLYNKNRSWFGKEIDKFKNGVFGIAGVLYGSSVTIKDLEDDTGQEVAQNTDQNPVPAPILLPVPPPPAPVPAESKPPKQPIPESKPVASNTVNPSSLKTSSITQPAVSPRHILTFAANTSLDSRVRGNDSTTGNSGGIGIVEGNTPPAQNSSGAASVPTPSPAPTLSSATSTATTTTPTPVPPPPADTTSPNISLIVSSCTASLSSSGCLIATTTIALNWSSSASDFDRYAVTCTTNGTACSNFSYASTTATSTTFIATDNTTYIFSATATDHTGNTSMASTTTVSIATRPIVINEIAWAGTSANRSEDEWIELHNITDYDISLTNWVLRSTTDNTPYVHLTNTIAAKSYFVLERTSSTTISDVTENQIYTGALNNSGEVLELSYASTTMDKTPTCSSAWCYGSASPNYNTMERHDPYTGGDNQFNWGSWANFGASNKNADNAAIHGTPGRRNSLNYLINKGSVTIGANTTLKKSESPYIITATNLSISNVTVDVEAGVVIKFSGGSSLTINGIMKTHGTASEPVVFTSINDDAYGGDVNGDGTTTPAAAGDWNTIQPTTSGSIFDYAIIRYGGKIDQFYGFTRAQLQAVNVGITITNSTFELSKTHGLYLSNVSGEVSSSTLRDNRASSGNAGLEVSAGGGIVIRNNTFVRNSIGLSIGGSSSQTTPVSNNSFLGNDQSAISFGGGKVSFSASSASGNGIDGILTTPSLLNGITLVPDLPYIFDSNTTRAVSTGSTLAISPGVIFKFKSASALYIDGALDSQGTVALPIVFTSFHDDGCGITAGCGDTNKATTSPAAGDWGGLIFRSKGATASTLAHAIVRYGGNKNANIGDLGAVAVQNGTSTVVISNSTIEKSFFAGIAAIGSGTASTTITNSIIRDNLVTFGSATGGYGVWTSSSANPTISNTRFSNNGTNIATSSASWTDGGGNVGE